MDRSLSLGQAVLATVVAICVLATAYLLFVPSLSPTPVMPTSCLSNIKQLALAQMLYASDYDDRWPRATQWVDLTLPYTKNSDIFRCPLLPKGEYGFAMSDAMSEKKMPPSGSGTTKVLLFESTDIRRNAHGTLAIFASPGRHKGSSGVAYADGHAKMIADGKSP